MKIVIWQDKSEVTGSCIVVRVEENGKELVFAIDCGMYQEDESRNAEPLPVKAEELAFLAVTHPHLDHIGRIPQLIQSGYTGPIFTSNVSKEIIKIALQCQYYQIIGCEYNQQITVLETQETKLQIMFMKNAHVFGASFIFVKIQCRGYEEANLFFSGDYNSHNLLFRGSRVPKAVLEAPNLVAVVESTYATKKKNKKKCFEQNVLRWALKNPKGTLIIPVYSLGKTQEVLYLLKKLQIMLPEIFNMPIFLDGKLTQEYSKLYYKLQEFKLLKVYKGKEDIFPNSLYFIDGNARNKEYFRRELAKQERKIIVSSSGNGSMGYSYEYIKMYLDDPNTLIHFCGYCSPNSLGGMLESSEIGDSIPFGDCSKIRRAEVKYTSEFSGHCSGEEIIGLLKRFSNLKMVLVNHGSSEGKEVLREKISREFNLPTGKLGEGKAYVITCMKNDVL